MEIISHPYKPEVGDTVVCNPELPQAVFQASGLPTEQNYQIASVGPDSEGNDVYVSVLGEDGHTYGKFGPAFFVKKIMH